MLFLILSLLTVNGSLNVELWVDREDAVYYPTDNLRIFFRTNRDCFVAVFNIEKGGRVNMLFPQEEEDGWVEAGRVYQLPPRNADYDYVVSGPEGIETIIAVASINRLPTLQDEGPDIVSEAVDIYIREPEPARLSIVSKPNNCRIYITEAESGDEEYIGKTPRTIVMRPGEYTVEIKKVGYRTLKRRIWLDPGERRRVFVELRRY